MAEAASLMPAPEQYDDRIVLQAHRALIVHFQRQVLFGSIRVFYNTKELLR
jgi:hypothetical protein